MTPLHYACLAKATTTTFVPSLVAEDLISVVELILYQHPTSCTVMEFSGAFPLHYAIANRSIGIEVLQLLVQVFPQALEYQDPQSKLYPAQKLAARLSSSEDVTFFYGYLRSCSNILQYHRYSW